MKCIATALLAIVLLGSSGARPLTMQLQGRWEVATGHHDGRHAGTSVRSFHPGDALDVELNGTGVRIYGITGPTGGLATVLVSDRPDRTIDFYSPVKETHVLLYQSQHLARGWHYAVLVVSARHDASSRGTYVNVDTIQLLQ